MKRISWILIATALAWGCDGGEATTPDGGTNTTDDGGTTTPGDDDGGTTTPGDDDGGTTEPPAGDWTFHAHPCVGNRTDALWRDDDGTLYLGCGSNADGDVGLFVSKDDGATWNEPPTTPPSFFDTWRVLDISRSADGLLYVAGNDTASSRRVVSADTSGASWALDEVYNAGSTVGTSFNVGTFRRTAEGRAVAESHTGTDIQARQSDDAEWQDVSSWDDEHGGLQLLDLEIHDGEFYGCGSTISNPPYLFLPPEPGSGFGFRVVDLAGDGIGSYRGEMWGLAVDDAGIVVGGVNQDADVGMIYALDGADATEMRTFHVSELFPDDATWIRGVCRSGETLYAVGEMQMKGEGIVLRSEDNGATWSNVTPDTGDPASPLPPVQRCIVTADGTAYIAGGAGAFVVSN